MIPELRAQIERSSGDRESLRRVQALLPADDGELDRLIEEILAEGQTNAFGFVVLAGLAANRPVDARHLAKSTSVLLQSARLATIAFRMRGNVAQHLFEALDAEPFEPDEAAFILLLIAVWSRECAHADFPRELFPRTRELLRIPELDKKAKEHLLAIAVYTENAALMDLLCRHHYPATALESERARTHELVQQLLVLKNKPFLHDMPEKAGLRLSYGDTMRRAVPQTGRNEPCHCGSGRKYKHCCLEKDNERLRSATDIAGVTRQELLAAPEVYYTPERLDVAHRFEVLAIDPLRLPPALIERYCPSGMSRQRTPPRRTATFGRSSTPRDAKPANCVKNSNAAAKR